MHCQGLCSPEVYQKSQCIHVHWISNPIRPVRLNAVQDHEKDLSHVLLPPSSRMWRLFLPLAPEGLIPAGKISLSAKTPAEAAAPLTNFWRVKNPLATKILPRLPPPRPNDMQRRICLSADKTLSRSLINFRLVDTDKRCSREICDRHGLPLANIPESITESKFIRIFGVFWSPIASPV